MTQEMASAEAIAYALFERVCYAERKDVGLISGKAEGWERPSRHWIISTYAECLEAVRSPDRLRDKDDLEARSDPSGHRYVPREAILGSSPV